MKEIRWMAKVAMFVAVAFQVGCASQPQLKGPPRIHFIPKISVKSPPTPSSKPQWKSDSNNDLCAGFTPAEWRVWNGPIIQILYKDAANTTSIEVSSFSIHVKENSVVHHIAISSNRDGNSDWWVDGQKYTPTCDQGGDKPCRLPSFACNEWVESWAGPEWVVNFADTNRTRTR